MKNTSFRDKLLTRVSIILLIVIFIFQAGILYRLFQTNMNLLVRELNLSVEEAYSFDLNNRLGVGDSSTPSIKVAAIGEEEYETIDTTNVVYLGEHDRVSGDKTSDALALLNIAVEEYASQKRPIDLARFDSVVSQTLLRKDIHLQFYSEVVDVATGKIFETTSSPSVHSSDVLPSKNIPLNLSQSKVLRVVLIDPIGEVFPQMAWMLFLSLLFSLVCIYGMYYQLKTLSKQRRLASLKSDFFSEVSHEFKRPLAVLRQAINSLENEKILVDVAKRKRLLHIADFEITKMTGKTEMLLSLAMDDEGIFELNKTDFDLVKLVYDLADEALDSSSKSIDIDVDNQLTYKNICADESHMEQVISNIIGNAIKYSKAVVDIQIAMYEDRGYTCISIKDNGIGISEKDLNVIFKKYARAENSTNAKGHGIGLNYVKRIVDKHDGLLEVTSSLNEGSEFIVKLPNTK